MRNPDPKKSAEQNIEHLEGVSRFLLSNIVQGKRADDGKYSE